MESGRGQDSRPIQGTGFNTGRLSAAAHIGAIIACAVGITNFTDPRSAPVQIDAVRSTLTPKQAAHRNRRNKIAAASRKRNRL